MLYEHQNNITELKRDGAVAVTLEQSQHRDREGELNQEKRTLKVHNTRPEIKRKSAPLAPTVEIFIHDFLFFLSFNDNRR